MNRLAALIAILAVPLFANYPNQTCVLLDTGAKTAIITNSGSAGGTETILFAPSGSERARFCFSPINVPLTDAETYTACANPCGTGGTVTLMTADLGTGRFYRFGEYRDTSGNALSPRKKISKLIIPQHEIATITTSPLPMPREVIGQDYYATHVQVTAAAGSGTVRLWLRINSTLFYDAKGSVQINGKKPSTGAVGWDDITASSATILDEWNYYGPLNHTPIRTLILTMPITAGVLATGTNVVGFRMNLTDGVTSGYRVLEFNFIEADKQLDSISVTSNVATVTSHAAHGYSSSDQVKVHGAPDRYGVFNGSRTITVTGGSAFTFTPCGTNPNMLSCTSPNGTYAPPISTDTGLAPQPLMYAARQLIAQSAFVWTDPTAFAAPGGSDAAAGATLWGSAALVVPNAPFIGNASVATCGSCHSLTGLDLKYFNFSNYSIKQRSIFHGLTSQNGDDIAAYIRGLDLTVPTIARPWNPPYQPGPGLDSGTWWDWSAGAGVDSVLMYERDWFRYACPSGVPCTTWPYNAAYNSHEVPLIRQFMDWNTWLPQVFPQDAFTSPSFTASTYYSMYTSLRAALAPCKQSGTINSGAATLVTVANCSCSTNDILMIDDEAVKATAGCGTTSVSITRAQGGTTAASHTSARVGNFTKFNTPSGGYGGNGGYFGFDAPCITPCWSDYQIAISPTGNGSLPTPVQAGFVSPSPYIQNYFAFKSWNLTKWWEAQHEGNLENMLGQLYNNLYGVCTTCPGGSYVTRGWYSKILFIEGFHAGLANSQVNTIDAGAGNGIGYFCQTDAWYLLQIANNAGDGNFIGNTPWDEPYTFGFLNDCGIQTRPVGMMVMLPSFVAPQQTAQLNNEIVRVWSMGLSFIVDGSKTKNLAFLTSGETTAFYTQVATLLTSIIPSISTATWQAQVAGEPIAACSSNTTPAQFASSTRTVCDGLALLMPRLVYYGVASGTIDTIQTWAALLWPAVNWATQRAATCLPNSPNPIDCTNQHP